MKFLGLTKLQWQGALTVSIVVAFMLITYTMYEQRLLAEQGAQSHAALCVYKGDKLRELARTQAYIQSDTNGTILGFPRKLWVKSERDLQSTVSSLSKLHC